MSIALDTTSNGGGNGGTSTVSWSHTCSGSNRILIVAATADYNAISDVTYGGVAMTLLVQSQPSGNPTTDAQLFYMLNPPLGTHTVTIDTASFASCTGASISYTGVSQISFPDNFGHNETTSSPDAVSVTVVASGCWLVSVGSAFGSSNISTNLTDRISNQQGSNRGVLSDSNGIINQGSQTKTLTATSATFMGFVLASMSPVNTSGQHLTLLGVS